MREIHVGLSNYISVTMQIYILDNFPADQQLKFQEVSIVFSDVIYSLFKHHYPI